MEQNWHVKVLMLTMFLMFGGSEAKVLRVNHRAIYNHTLATILVEYASAVYMSDLTKLVSWTCSRCGGLTKGFDVIELVVDVENCLQAYVGVAADLNSVVIAFRGTQERSIQNWIEDLYWKQYAINYPGMTDAKVHHGFYTAYHNTTIRPGILSAVETAKAFYGDIKIIVTGHSMGGAMAAICALDLVVNLKAQDVQVMTFGQPRVGNEAFASYYKQVLPNAIRVVNNHDMVPHLPPYYSIIPRKTYHHFPTEVWLYDMALGSFVYPVEKVCDSSGEDPTCSRSVSGNSVSDHLVYYGVDLGCDIALSCGIVMDQHLNELGNVDDRGNLVLLKKPGVSFLEATATPDTAGSS